MFANLSHFELSEFVFWVKCSPIPWYCTAKQRTFGEMVPRSIGRSDRREGRVKKLQLSLPPVSLSLFPPFCYRLFLPFTLSFPSFAATFQKYIGCHDS